MDKYERAVAENPEILEKISEMKFETLLGEKLYEKIQSKMNADARGE
ncbi:MAG: hypothetical protein JJU29_18900 [Verrucomicrobia bacterium]|nr:hypothetical protein [Verrucomicrobiota bacterium]MCH8514133.1 hypothetical protein [Kiritimatiellia bacterium]